MCTYQRCITFSGFGYQCVKLFLGLWNQKAIPKRFKWAKPIAKYEIILEPKSQIKANMFTSTFTGRTKFDTQTKFLSRENYCKQM